MPCAQAAKEARIEQQRHLSRTTSLQKHLLANDMSRIHQNMHQGGLTIALPREIRENLARPELRELFDQLDKKQRGVVSLANMKKASPPSRVSITGANSGRTDSKQMRVQ